MILECSFLLQHLEIESFTRYKYIYLESIKLKECLNKDIILVLRCHGNVFRNVLTNVLSLNNRDTIKIYFYIKVLIYYIKNIRDARIIKEIN